MADIPSLERFLVRFSRTIARNRNRIEISALSAVEGRYKARIFNRGLDSNGRKIGNYSTRPMLIGAKSFRTKTQAGKVLGSKKNRRKLDWVKVKGRNLAVLEGGYKELREEQGLRTLFRSIQKGRTPTGDNVIGFTGKEDDLQRVKAEANEKRFNTDIFSLSKTEVRALDKAVLRELDVILKKL
jgi:hypothetical protein